MALRPKEETAVQHEPEECASILPSYVDSTVSSQPLEYTHVEAWVAKKLNEHEFQV